MFLLSWQARLCASAHALDFALIVISLLMLIPSNDKGETSSDGDTIDMTKVFSNLWMCPHCHAPLLDRFCPVLFALNRA